MTTMKSLGYQSLEWLCRSQARLCKGLAQPLQNANKGVMRRSSHWNGYAEAQYSRAKYFQVVLIAESNNRIRISCTSMIESYYE